MTDFLHPKFLSNEREYQAVEDLWRLNLSRLQRRGVEPYINNSFADGTPIKDGNPVASLVNWRTRRAARIVQENPDEFGDYYTAFTIRKNLPGVHSTLVNVEEKVIVLTLTQANLAKCLTELKQWLQS